MNDKEAAVFRGGKALVVSLVLCVIGVAILIGGAFVDGRRVLLAYLGAECFVVSTALGALVFLMTCHAMRATWPTLVRRVTEAVVAVLPFSLVLFLPVLLGVKVIYPWIHPETFEDARLREAMIARSGYLTVMGFCLRAVVYFVIWIAVAFVLRRLSRPRDAAQGVTARARMYAFSGALLPVVAFALSFAAFDWLMSLSPGWYSTMFPVRWFAGGFIGSLALITILTALADRAGLLPGVNPSHYYALGRLLLSFVIFWAYTEYFQLMLIWIADKPDEVTFYLARARGGHLGLSVILALVEFLIPFVVLLSYDLKRKRGPLAAMAAWILAGHYLDSHWLVIPSGAPHAVPVHWIDLGALLAVVGASVAYGVLRLRGESLVPVHDPALPDAIRYESL